MSYTVNFHTDDATAVHVARVNERAIALHIGDYPGECVTVFGPLERLQRLVAQLHVGLEQFEPGHQQREHDVVCLNCRVNRTWNVSAVCDRCETIAKQFKPETVSA